MTEDETPVEVVRRMILEGMDEVDETVIQEVCVDEIELMGRSGALPSEDIIQNTEHFYEAFPDFDHEIIDMWEDDGTVTVHYKNTGTFENELQIEGDPIFGDREIEPNGEEVEYYGVYLVGVENGEITKWMNYTERLRVLQQTGVLPDMDEIHS